MAELCFRWGDRQAQDRPAPPQGATVTLLVGEQVVLEAVVTEELSAWARWCALQMADRWDCPEVARRYLETGDEILGAATQRAAREAFAAAGRTETKGPARATILAVESATHWSAAGAAARAITFAVGPHAAGPVRTEQEVHLRRLLLQRALPQHLWPLIDSDAPNAEQVLCDALLEGRGP